MTAQLAPPPVFRSWDNLGLPLVGGKLNTYVAGTTTRQATYVDSTQTTPNTNPVILNFRGEAFVWTDPALTYKFVLTDALGNLIWTEDNIPGGPFISSTGSILIPASLIPTPTNTLTLGNPTNSWANIYLGPNNAPALDSVSGNIGYFARTPAEVTANVTPANFSYDPDPIIDLRRYGLSAAASAATNTLAIQNAIAVAAVSGAQIDAPQGSFNFNNPISICTQGNANKNVWINGAGKRATNFISNGTGNGFQTTSALNSSTAINVKITNLTIQNTNASNVGGGYTDVGGTFIELTNVRVAGFQFSMIFDQSELADVDLCDIEFPLVAGAWLVNGPDHTPGANTGFTNRISIKRSQFNNAAGTGIAIIDDGGTSHTLEDNDYSGWAVHLRSSNGTALRIVGGEWEACTSNCIIFATTTFNGVTVPKSYGVTIEGNSFGPALGQFAINIGTSALGQTAIFSNAFSTTSASAITGMANCSLLFAGGNAVSTGAMCDALAAAHFESDLAAGVRTNQALTVSGVQSRFNSQTTATGPGGSSLTFSFPFAYVGGALYQIQRGAYDSTGTIYSQRVSYWFETASGTFVEQTTRTMDLQGGSATVTTDMVTRSGGNVVVTVFVAHSGTSFTNYANVIRMN